MERNTKPKHSQWYYLYILRGKFFDCFLTCVSGDQFINLNPHVEHQRELKQVLRMKFGCYWLKRKPNLKEIKRMQIILSITEV